MKKVLRFQQLNPGGSFTLGNMFYCLKAPQAIMTDVEYTTARRALARRKHINILWQTFHLHMKQMLIYSEQEKQSG